MSFNVFFFDLLDFFFSLNNVIWLFHFLFMIRNCLIFNRERWHPHRQLNLFIVYISLGLIILLKVNELTTTLGCICLRIKAADFPVISWGLMQCLIAFAAYLFSKNLVKVKLPSMTVMQPLDIGTVKPPFVKP